MTAPNRRMILLRRLDKVNAPPEDRVFSLCTAYPTTTQKPTMLGDWQK